ncbi:MAG: BppU family phage baseplate upper protein [Clostridium perfringens]
MKEIFINVDAYNSDGIKTIQGNNNAEVYKIYVLFNKRRIDLNGKTVKMAYLRTGTVEGDVINLEVTNAQEGEITLQITNAISKRDGVYSCQLAIYGAAGFLEHTATFGLTVEANIFNKIADEIADTKDLTYIERILEEAINTSEELKSNIPVARQLNIDLENQNRILNENIDRANGVNNTLITTTEQSKVAATDAIEKKSQLESSIVEAKKFIDGLDGSQNIPQIRLDVTELQNGLKSNQSLEYSGSSITANDTLEGRTEGMRISGRTLNNLYKANNIREDAGGKYILVDTFVKDEPKDRVVYIVNNTNRILLLNVYKISGGWDSNPIIRENSISKLDLTGKKLTGFLGMYDRGWTNSEADKELLRNTCIVLDREETYIPQKYFEGLKSFGEAEQEGDKYKISILSCGKNILKPLKNYSTINGFNLNNILKNGVQYTVTNTKNQLIKIAEFKDADTFLGQSTNGKFTFTFDNSKQQKLYIWKKYDSQVAELFTNEDIDFVMIEEGTGTIFEPYKEDKKDILIKEPLRSIGDFSDVMYEDNGQVKITRNIVTYTFTGDEKFSLIASDSQGNYISFLYTSLNNRKYQTKLISNNFVKLSSSQENKEGIYCYSSNFNISIRVLKSKLNTQDVEGFKAWLKANPTTIVYQLSTPVTEIVENCVDIDLDTFQDKTYFSILNSLPGNLDFKVPSNIGSVVQNMAKEVNNIWDVINNLLVPGLIDVNKTVAMATIKNNLQ